MTRAQIYKMRTDPVAFIETMLPEVTLAPWQKEILKALNNSEKDFLFNPRRAGLTHLKGLMEKAQDATQL